MGYSNLAVAAFLILTVGAMLVIMPPPTRLVRRWLRHDIEEPDFAVIGVKAKLARDALAAVILAVLGVVLGGLFFSTPLLSHASYRYEGSEYALIIAATLAAVLLGELFTGSARTVRGAWLRPRGLREIVPRAPLTVAGVLAVALPVGAFAEYAAFQSAAKELLRTHRIEDYDDGFYAVPVGGGLSVGAVTAQVVFGLSVVVTILVCLVIHRAGHRRALADVEAAADMTLRRITTQRALGLTLATQTLMVGVLLPALSLLTRPIIRPPNDWSAPVLDAYGWTVALGGAFVVLGLVGWLAVAVATFVNGPLWWPGVKHRRARKEALALTGGAGPEANGS